MSAAVTWRGGSFLENMKKRLHKLETHVLTVGIQGPGAREMRDGVTLATIGAFNEYGTKNIPERSFLRAALLEHLDEIRRTMLEASVRITRGENPVEALAGAGVQVSRLVKNRLIRSFSWAKPNADSTVKAKGFNYPLFEEGDLPGFDHLGRPEDQQHADRPPREPTVSNTSNIFDLSAEDLAAFLAKSVGDGTYDDIFGALKSDRTGYETDATGIAQSPGQIWANGVDDFIQTAYPLLKAANDGAVGASTSTSRATYTGQTTNDTPLELHDYGAAVAGSFLRVTIKGWGKKAAGDAVFSSVEALFEVDGVGTMSLMALIAKPDTYSIGGTLSTATLAFDIVSDQLQILALGEAATTIDWVVDVEIQKVFE